MRAITAFILLSLMVPCLAASLFPAPSKKQPNPVLFNPTTPEAKRYAEIIHQTFNAEADQVEFVINRFNLPSNSANPGLSNTLNSINNINDLLTKEIGSEFGVGFKVNF